MRALWVPAVNGAGRYGRWDFVLLDGPYGVAEAIRDHLAGRKPRAKPFALTADSI